ncbi:MAG: protein translocase subunit SecF [Polyangiaceae bacterium]
MYIIKPGKLYDFMGMRKYFLFLSVILLGGSLVALFYPGPKWGTDFRGGTEVELTFKQKLEPAQVRQAVEEIKAPDGSKQFESAEVVAVPDRANAFIIRVQEVSAVPEHVQREVQKKLCFIEDELPADCTKELTPTEVKFSPGGDRVTLRYSWNLEGVDDREKGDNEKTARDLKYDELTAQVASRFEGTQLTLIGGKDAVKLVNRRDNKIEVHLKSKGDQLMEGIRTKFGPDIAPDPEDKNTQVKWIGPKAGAQLRNAAFKSIGIAIFFIMAYIALRFDLRFAPGAVIALIHDVLISVGAMCVTQKEFSLSTVAAILTILGYSLTDTVVVYDRIRENLSRHRGMSFSQIVNHSVSEMFGRTLITSMTAAVSMVMFLVFGTQVIRDFAFVMLVGIAVGTYSSIYIAAPFTEWIDRRFFGSKAVVKAKLPRTRAQRKADAVV